MRYVAALRKYLPHLFPQFLNAIDDLSGNTFVHHGLVRGDVQQHQHLQDTSRVVELPKMLNVIYFYIYSKLKSLSFLYSFLHLKKSIIHISW